MPRISRKIPGCLSCRILVASPPSSSTMFGVQPPDGPLAGPRRVCSMHHSYSSSLSPFQAKTGMPRAAIAAAAWSWVEKMLHELQRTVAPRCIKVSINTAVWIVMCRQPTTRAPASRRAAPNSSLPRSGGCRPSFREQRRLLQDGLRCLFLLIRRVAVFAQDALDEHAQLGTDVFAHCPVDTRILSYRRDQLAGDRLERRLAQHLDRAVVGFESVVKRELLFRKPELLAARIRRAHLLGECDQLLDHLCRLDRAIPVFAQRLLQELGERARLDDVAPRPSSNLARQQLLQKLDGEVPLRHAADLGEEFVGKDRDVRLL